MGIRVDLSSLAKDGWKEDQSYSIPNYPTYGHFANNSIFTLLKCYGDYEVHISVHLKGNHKYDVVSCAEHRCTDPCTNIEAEEVVSDEVQSVIINCCTEWDKNFESCAINPRR